MCLSLVSWFFLVVVDLLCQYHSQVIGWKYSSPNYLLFVEWDVKLHTQTLASAASLKPYVDVFAAWYNRQTLQPA